jgi:hypothetical protein
MQLIDRTGIARVPIDVRWYAAAIGLATAAIVLAFR